MSRWCASVLEPIFERARNEGRLAFIPYVMAGDPDLATTGAILRALTDVGADAIEVGIPYGDPLADGPTIAAAAQRALENGVTTSDVFALIRRFRDDGGAPVILFTYFNPVFKYGTERFARDAASAGASAAIVPDIALEEGVELRGFLKARGLDMPLLIAPSTKKARAQRIVAQSTGFVYVVSRLGVTGAGSAPGEAALREQIAMLREMTKSPLALGFGISSVTHVRRAAALADGVIVGSAIIDAYTGTRGGEAVERVRGFVQPLVDAASTSTSLAE